MMDNYHMFKLIIENYLLHGDAETDLRIEFEKEMLYLTRNAKNELQCNSCIECRPNFKVTKVSLDDDGTGFDILGERDGKYCSTFVFDGGYCYACVISVNLTSWEAYD